MKRRYCFHLTITKQVTAWKCLSNLLMETRQHISIKWNVHSLSSIFPSSISHHLFMNTLFRSHSFLRNVLWQSLIVNLFSSSARDLECRVLKKNVHTTSKNSFSFMKKKNIGIFASTLFAISTSVFQFLISASFIEHLPILNNSEKGFKIMH